MNINPIMQELGKVVGYPVEQDEYEGSENIFITFTYVDEGYELYGDNTPEVETCYIQLSLYTPKNFDYLDKKEEIKQFLAARGFIDITSRSWLEEQILGTQKRRHTIFECHITKGIGK